MRTTRRSALQALFALGVVSMIAPGAAAADDDDKRGRGRGRGRGGDDGDDGQGRGRGEGRGRGRGPKGGARDGWRRGQVLPPGQRGNVARDPYRYGLYPPPRGHAWVRVGPDMYLIAVQSGVIREVVRDSY